MICIRMIHNTLPMKQRRMSFLRKLRKIPKPAHSRIPTALKAKALIRRAQKLKALYRVKKVRLITLYPGQKQQFRQEALLHEK